LPPLRSNVEPPLCVGWTQIFGGKASEPETSRPVEKRSFTYTPPAGDPIRILYRSFALRVPGGPGLSCGVVFEILSYV